MCSGLAVEAGSPTGNCASLVVLRARKVSILLGVPWQPSPSSPKDAAVSIPYRLGSVTVLCSRGDAICVVLMSSIHLWVLVGMGTPRPSFIVIGVRDQGDSVGARNEFVMILTNWHRVWAVWR